MNKEIIQQRILKNGKPLDLSKFCWDEKTTTFYSDEDNLVIDFSNINSATIDCGYQATIDCGNSATIKCWHYATIKCGYQATIDCGNSATIKCGFNATIDCGDYTIIKCVDSVTIKCGNSATIDCGSNATIKCGDENVIVRRGIFQVIQPTKGSIIQTAPYDIKGYIQDGIYSETGRPAIIADRILSEVLSKKEKNGTIIYRVINHGQTEKSYLLEIDGVYSHGKTLKEAKESYKYKIATRDTSEFKHLTLDSVITEVEAIKLYRAVTGACESGTRYFVENLENAPKKLTVKELIRLTKGQFNHDLLVKFIESKEVE